MLSLIILFMRLWLPESPRGDDARRSGGRARRLVARIEADLAARHVLSGGGSGDALPTIRLRVRTAYAVGSRWPDVARRAASAHCVGLSLMAAQAFFYNAIFSPMR